jgi:transposase
MPRAYSLDLRERVLTAARDDNLSHGALAARFRIGELMVRGWLRRARETGTITPKHHGGGTPPKLGAAGNAVLTALVAERNERPLAELAGLYRYVTATQHPRHGAKIDEHAAWGVPGQRVLSGCWYRD